MSNKMNWKPVSEYTQQPHGTFLVLWQNEADENQWADMLLVVDSEDGVDELVFENGYKMLSDEWGTVSHFLIISPPNQDEGE